MSAAVTGPVATHAVHAEVHPDEHGEEGRVEYPAAVRLPEIRHIHHLFRIGFTARCERTPPGSAHGTEERAAVRCVSWTQGSRTRAGRRSDRRSGGGTSQ